MGIIFDGEIKLSKNSKFPANKETHPRGMGRVYYQIAGFAVRLIMLLLAKGLLYPVLKA
jgi:hypothetical protein